MPDFAVNTAFMATNRTTPALKNMSAHMAIFGKTGTAAIMKVNAAMSPLIARTKMYGKLALGIGAALVAKQFVEFDDAITAASAKFPDLNRNTAEGQKTLEALRKTARKVGIDTEHSAGQAAKGLDYLAMAGFDAKQSMVLLPGVSNLATAANIDFARASDIASDALGAFNLMTKDTNQLGINFTRVQDVMAKTVTSTNTNMEDLFETIKFGAPAFTAAGQSMETFNAIAGRMASSGIKSSNAGTALRSAITRLQKPTKEVMAGLGAFGLSMSDIVKDGKLMDMVDIMGLFEKNGKKMTRVERNAALTMIVGKNAVSAWAAVMNEGVEQTRKLKESLDDSNGSAKLMAEIMRKSLGNRIKYLLSTLTELGFRFMEGFIGKGSESITSFSKAISRLGWVFELLGKALNLIIKLLPVLIPLFAAYKIALFYQVHKTTIAVIRTFGLLQWTMKSTALGQMALAVKTKAVAAAQWAWNAAMAANPIALIIAGIVALGAAAYMVIKHWEAVKKFFVDLWALISKVFASLSSFSASGLEAELRSSISSPKVSSENNINFEGNLNIAGAPKGSTATGKTRGAPPIKMDLMGAMD